jgi:hypothetical protein
MPSSEGEGVGFGRVYRKCGQTIPFFPCLTFSVHSGLGRFATMVMVVKRGEATDVLGFSNSVV